MNRRQFVLSGIAAASAFAADRTISVTVQPDRPIGPVASDFLGLGYEISSVARPGLLDRDNRVYVEMVRKLSPRGVIRIGGNTSDYSHYSPSGQPVSSPKGTIVNDAVLNDLGGFLDATGWKLIWGLNLGTASAAEAIAEATAVQRAAGKNLLALEIGNEPDLFGRAKHRPPDYSYSDWLAEYRRYKKKLRAALPGIPFAGPDAAANNDWVTRFAADEGKDAVLLTHHYYREGQNPSSTIEKLLGVDPKLQPELDQFRDASRSCGLPYRICEVNSFSGGGRPGVSDTMAGALWALDYMFTLAANGCSGVNMETGVNQLGFISSYSPIGDDEQGHYSARAEYFGMLAFARAARGRMLGVQMDPDSPELKAYATQPEAKTLLLTLINKGPAAASFSIDTHHGGRASLRRLTAPSVDAKSGLTFGQPAGRLPVQKGRLALEVPGYSAAVVEIR